ncbi:MAG: leucine-rich repeat domain-containing protein [Segatella copri]|nr:leucine-rich repeat domain-containing protein [Segatella copri]
MITKQITIKLEEAGTLPDKIGSTKKNQITNLKIIGEINSTDLRMIREMAGKDEWDTPTNGMLSVLDLLDAKIVEGGDYYYEYYYTSNDKIGDYAFFGCSGLTSLTLPSGVTEIGDYAFSGCSGLTSLTLPSGVTEIGDYAFSGCSGLTSLTLPSGLTEIGHKAFNGCSGLTSLTLPSGLAKIGSYVFYGCSGLTSLTLPSSLTEISYCAFSGCSGLTSLTLPSGVTKIGGYAFSGCSGLTSLTFPSGVTEIGGYAFSGCSGLTSLTFPSGVTKIGGYAFSGCSGLTSIYVYAEKLPNMESYVFGGCDAKKCTVYVPKGTYDDYWLSEFGYFENIVEFDPTGINNVITSNDTKELSRYSLNGQRLSAPTKGLNIVKYSDGSVKKVAVQ